MRGALALIAFLAAAACAAAIGSLATLDAADQYQQLEQPAWAPPGWLFGPVWTLLYIGIGVAGWMLWRAGGWRDPALAAWAAQLVINALWSPLFFAWELRGLALAWIIVLDAAVIATIVLAWRRERVAAWILVPYLAWILFATALNAAVWWLNRP